MTEQKRSAMICLYPELYSELALLPDGSIQELYGKSSSESRGILVKAGVEQVTWFGPGLLAGTYPVEDWLDWVETTEFTDDTIDVEEKRA